MFIILAEIFSKTLFFDATEYYRSIIKTRRKTASLCAFFIYNISQLKPLIQTRSITMNMTKILMLSCSTALLLAGISSQSMAKEYYKWVDAKGSTHYTTTPPPKNAKKQGKAQTHGWSNSAPYQPNAETKPETRPENATPTQSTTPTPQDQQQREANEALKKGQNGKAV